MDRTTMVKYTPVNVIHVYPMPKTKYSPLIIFNLKSSWMLHLISGEYNDHII